MASIQASKVNEALERAEHGERVVIEREGREVAAVIPIEDLRLFEELEDEIDLREALRVLADESDETIPWEEAEKRLDARRG